MRAGASGYVVLAWMVFLLATGQSAAESPVAVQIELFSGRPQNTVTVREQSDLAPVLDKCLFENIELKTTMISPRTFSLKCIVPYINGLWLDPRVLYRSKADIIEQATDRLIEHPAGEPFPVFYPPRLAGVLKVFRSNLRSLAPQGIGWLDLFTAFWRRRRVLGGVLRHHAACLLMSWRRAM